MSVTITIAHEGRQYIPEARGSAIWETQTDAPGRFVFYVPAELPLAEGDAVRCEADGKPFFCGYVFSRRYSEKGETFVTAYDQTRYLKNRDTYIYDGITASALLRRIAGEHNLKLGDVPDTVKLLEPCVEDNKTLADIIKNALRRTEEAGGGRFILFDDCGSLSLKPAGDLFLNILVDGSCGQTFMRTVSVDEDTYNAIKLVCDSKNGRNTYTASDGQNIERWGKLQYFQKINEDYNGSQKAAELLKLYNKESRELFIGGVYGDTRVRAASSLMAGGAITGGGNDIYTVECARHVWQEGLHTMDLTLRQ